jgi:DNA-directed RNA polymerase specialized sigma24 family protein
MQDHIFQNEFLQLQDGLKSFLYRLVANKQDAEDLQCKFQVMLQEYIIQS